ncbi:protein NLRC5 [Thomomys bottae]
MNQETRTSPSLMDSLSQQQDSRNLWSWLVSLLSKHPEWLSAKMRSFLPTTELSSSGEAPDVEQRVTQQLRKLHAQGQNTWKSLVQCVCMELELPLELEVRLLSTSCHDENELPGQLGAGEENQSAPLLFCLKPPVQSCNSSTCLKYGRKQQLAELARKYLDLLKVFAHQLHGSKCSGPGQILTSHQHYVPAILQWSRATAPLDTQERTIVRDPKTEDGDNVSIQDLFNFRAHKGPRVTVLLGKAGMGKTTLTRRLCQKWAEDQLDHFQALFLFEFRQLNLIKRFLTLPQLLFDLYLSPESGSNAVFQYLEENADRVLLIFDGLDEALGPCSNQETLGPDGSASVLTLFSNLCHGTLLPGCWVITTSRPGKLPTCLPKAAAVVHMWGFNEQRVEEYMSHFFSEQPSKEMILKELRANGHLRSMCTVPALCQVTCLCLHHLLPRTPVGQSAALLPTVTQLYIQMVLSLIPCEDLPATSLLGLGEVALAGLDTRKVIFSSEDIPPALMAFGATHRLLTSFSICTSPGHQETGCAFAHLSLQEFFAALYLMASPRVDRDTLTCRVTLNSHWVLRTKGRLGLSDQLPTFLAGLASETCRPFLSQLANKNEAWVSARQAAVMQALRKLAIRKLTGPKMVELCHCVTETQEAELATLIAQGLPYHLSFHNFPLSFADLAALAGILKHRADPLHLEFEGCPLEPHCPEALIGCEQVESLSFKSRKCGDAFAEALSRSLPSMGNLQKLGLMGSKVTARGISHLIQALPRCLQLEEVSLQDNQLKDQEVLDIVKVLPQLPRLHKLDLSRNSFSVSTLLSLVTVAVTRPTVRMLQVRETDLIFLLSPPTKTELQRVSDLQETVSLKKEAQDRSLILRLQKCRLRVCDMEVLIHLLQQGPPLEEVDLSENHLEDEGCRLLAEAVPQLNITKKLDLSDNRLSISGVAYMLAAVDTCWSLAELHISLLHKTVVLMFAQEAGMQEGACESLSPLGTSDLPSGSRNIRLTHCGFQAKHIEELYKALGGSRDYHHPGQLGHLDLSGNALGDDGVALLAQLLPGLGPLQSLNLSKNGSSLDAVLTLAQSMATLPWVFHLDVSFENQHILLTGDKRGSGALAGGPFPELPAGTQILRFGQRCIPRTFSVKAYPLNPSSLTRLFHSLEACPGPLEVWLSCEALSDKSLEALLPCLSRMPQLSLLQLSQTGLAPWSPWLLAGILPLCPQIRKLEIRSLNQATLHFGCREELKGLYCGFPACGLRPAHMEQLCCLLGQCEALSHLNLEANLLDNEGLRSVLEYLQQTPLSGWLDLSHNNISQEGVLSLVEMLPSSPRVQEAWVNLGPEQQFQLRFSRQETSGVTLRLSHCHLGPEQVLRLAAGLSHTLQPTELTLTECGVDLKQLMGLLSRVKPPAGVLGLRIEEPWVGRAGVPTLLEACTQTLGHLMEISIAETQLWLQMEFPREEQWPQQALRLAHQATGTPHSHLVTQLVETCGRLRQLSLSQVNLCREGMQGMDSSRLLLSLLPALSELKTFRLTSSCASTEDLIHLASGLSHCHYLEELDFSSSQLGEEGTKMLMAALEGMRRLKRLRLNENSIGDTGCYRLSQALRAAGSLEELGLSHNQIGDAGAQHVAATLPELPELRKIDLSRNGIGPETGAQLAESLTLCQHLEALMLGYNALGDLTALRLARGLPQHLRVLHLPGSHLSPEGALSLGWALDGHPHVEEINLAENSLAEGVPHFCKGLPQLRRISLVSCRIDDQTAKPLASSFMLCPALEEILLSWNLLGDKAAAELAQVLPWMGQLKKVDLEKNQISARGAWLLLQGLAPEAGVPVIRLWNNPISLDMVQHLQSQEPRLNFAFADKHPWRLVTQTWRTRDQAAAEAPALTLTCLAAEDPQPELQPGSAAQGPGFAGSEGAIFPPGPLARPPASRSDCPERSAERAEHSGARRSETKQAPGGREPALPARTLGSPAPQPRASGTLVVPGAPAAASGRDGAPAPGSARPAPPRPAFPPTPALGRREEPEPPPPAGPGGRPASSERASVRRRTERAWPRGQRPDRSRASDPAERRRAGRCPAARSAGNGRRVVSSSARGARGEWGPAGGAAWVRAGARVAGSRGGGEPEARCPPSPPGLRTGVDAAPARPRGGAPPAPRPRAGRDGAGGPWPSGRALGLRGRVGAPVSRDPLEAVRGPPALQAAISRPGTPWRPAAPLPASPQLPGLKRGSGAGQLPTSRSVCKLVFAQRLSGTCVLKGWGRRKRPPLSSPSRKMLLVENRGAARLFPGFPGSEGPPRQGTGACKVGDFCLDEWCAGEAFTHKTDILIGVCKLWQLEPDLLATSADGHGRLGCALGSSVKWAHSQGYQRLSTNMRCGFTGILGMEMLVLGTYQRAVDSRVEEVMGKTVRQTRRGLPGSKSLGAKQVEEVVDGGCYRMVPAH